MPRNIQKDIASVYAKLCAALTEYETGQRFLSYSRIMERYHCSRRVLEGVLARMEAEKLIRVEPQVGIIVRKKRAPAERRIVVMHNDWPAEYWQVLDSRFEAAFSAPGYRFSRRFPTPNTLFQVPDRTECDAVLMTYAFSKSSQADVSKILANEVPIIFLENHILCNGVNAIDSMPEYSGMLAADCLLRNGHRKIAVVISESVTLCCRREIDGFVRYLQLHGVTPLTIDCKPGSCESSMARTGDAVAGYLSKHGVHFTACFVLSVFSARGFCQAARALGFSIPGDISVVVNSEVPSAALSDPPFTTVARDFDGYVRAIREGLDDLFQGKSFGVRQVPSLLIERASVRNLNEGGTKGKV